MKNCDLKSMPIISFHKSDAIARPWSVTWKSEIELCQHESVSAFSTPCLTNKEVTPGIREEQTARDRHKTSLPVFNASLLPQFHSPPMTTQRMARAPAPREDDEKPLVDASTSATRSTHKLPGRAEMAQHFRRFWWAYGLAIAACITAVVAPV